MKKILLLLLLCSTTVYGKVVLNMTPPPPEDPIESKTALLTYPRSGTMWFQWCLTYGANRFWKKESRLWENFDLEIDFSRPLLLHTHHPHYLEKVYRPEKDKIILIVRNYRECMIRNYGVGSVSEIIRNIEGNPRKKLNVLWYFKNLELYDNWPEENRLLVYYEDLVKKPRKVFDRVLAFLGEDPDAMDDFFANYEEQREKSLAWRNSIGGFMIAQSRGKKLSFHSNRIPKRVRIQFDEVVKESYPHLWERYLKHYQFAPNYTNQQKTGI